MEHSKQIGHKAAIEKEIGEALQWQELPGKKPSRIAIYKLGADPSDEKQFTELHTWMMAQMERFKAAFALRVRQINLNSAPLDQSSDRDEPEE